MNANMPVKFTALSCRVAGRTVQLARWCLAKLVLVFPVETHTVDRTQWTRRQTRGTVMASTPAPAHL